MAWSIGSVPAERRAFLMQLESVDSKASTARPLSPTSDVGPGSVVGITSGRLVTVVSL